MKRLALIVCLLLPWFVPGQASAADIVPSVVQQPGTQPLEISNLESPDKCDNCHGGYNSSVEPAHNWRGSMMAHAGRDPIFWATLAIAEQDFDGAGDLCLRCHSTGGWLAGRSTPTDGSGLAAGDSDGVECDYCHKLTNPDDGEHQGVMNSPFIANGATEGWYGSGMSSMWGGNDKLGPYVDADARHQFMQSLFHRDRDFCGTCHDVSNPVIGDLAPGHGQLFSQENVVASGDPGPASPVNDKAAFNNPPYRYGVVERTFSEYKSAAISQTEVDDYMTLPEALRGGALQAVYQASYDPARKTADYEDGAIRYYSCQSCHMRAVTGTGANKQGVPVRSDLPLHDMTGGNYWMAEAIDYLNARGKLRLGGGMSPAQVQAMYDGALRAKEQLQLAATLAVESHEVEIINHTGHKLITGYPEGRRMWLNVKWYGSNGALLREDGAYGPLVDAAGQPVTVTNPATGQPTQVESILDLHDPNTRIYEAHMGMTAEWAGQLLALGYDAGLPLSYDRTSGAAALTLGELAGSGSGSAHETFHFALNNVVVKDNRIPPYGMDYNEAERRNASPVPQNQFEGRPGSVYEHYDEVPLNPPAGAAYADIDLLYQPTSWEYIQFLNLANTGGNAFLGAEGVNMLEAWLNTPTPMARPVVMASAAWQAETQVCSLGAPVLNSASAGDKAVTLGWSAATQGTPDGYALYYDQSGKAQLVASLDCAAGECLQFTDSGLTNGQQYCYKVSAFDSECESAFSNIMCATPQARGQVQTAAVTLTETGRWITAGKARDKYPVYQATTVFDAGDEIIVKLRVTDSTGTGVGGAQASIAITGPESLVLLSSVTDSQGNAEARWATVKPNKRGVGGTTSGAYTAAVLGLNSTSHQWDGTPSELDFDIAAP
jgi:hypothetical protein